MLGYGSERRAKDPRVAEMTEPAFLDCLFRYLLTLPPDQRSRREGSVEDLGQIQLGNVAACEYLSYINSTRSDNDSSAEKVKPGTTEDGPTTVEEVEALFANLDHQLAAHIAAQGDFVTAAHLRE